MGLSCQFLRGNSSFLTPSLWPLGAKGQGEVVPQGADSIAKAPAGTWAQPALHCTLQVISNGVPLVLALVPHRQPHSFITQGSSDLLVSAVGGAPPQLYPPHLYPKPTSAPSCSQVTVSANGLLGTHNWLPYDRNISNYFSFSKDPNMGSPK